MIAIKKTVLTFENLPANLGITKNIIFGVLDVSGIQKYIFGDMSTNSTLSDIRCRSAYIENLSHNLHQMLKDNFKGTYLFGSVSSGKVQCAFSNFISVSKLENYCMELQKKVFASTEGKLTFYYSFCKAHCIPSSKYSPEKMILAPAVVSKRIEDQKFNCMSLIHTNMAKDYCKEFRPFESTKHESLISKEISGAMAAVKLDLDNLGLFFRNLYEFDRRDRISISLNNTIEDCLSKDDRITPIFSGGDDIFFLCKAEEYLSVIVDFYSRFKNTVCGKAELSDYGKNGVFGICAGVVRILGEHGDVPVLIYSEKAEKKLYLAKTIGLKNCLCVGDCIISWNDLAILEGFYTRLREKLYVCDSEGVSSVFDLQLLKERILKFAHFNKNSLTKEERNAIESIKIVLL